MSLCSLKCDTNEDFLYKQYVLDEVVTRIIDYEAKKNTNPNCKKDTELIRLSVLYFNGVSLDGNCLISIISEIYQLSIATFPSNKFEAAPLGINMSFQRHWFFLQRNGEQIGSSIFRLFVRELKKTGAVTSKTLSEISEEYKIHLMPKRKKMRKITRRLIKTLDHGLFKQIRAFKFRHNAINIEDDNGFLPKIVIYVTGMEKVQYVAKVLKFDLSSLERHATKKNPPRFNKKITDLIWYSHTDSTCKQKAHELGCFDKYFENDGVHLKPLENGKSFHLNT